MNMIPNPGALIKFKIFVVWCAIVLCGGFLYAMLNNSNRATLTVLPEAPKQGEPVIVSYTLKNPMPVSSPIDYEFYIDGQPVQSGNLVLEPFSSAKYQYSNLKAPELGKQVSFALKTKDSFGEHEKIAALPNYPPQIFSSFTSFASFSTSVMSFMTSAPYYEETFGTQQGLNVGLVCSLALIALLIFLELSEPMIHGSGNGTLASLRLRFSTVTWILLTIFISMVFTRVVLILTT